MYVLLINNVYVLVNVKWLVKEYVDYVDKFLWSDKVVGWIVFIDLLYFCVFKKWFYIERFFYSSY